MKIFGGHYAQTITTPFPNPLSNMLTLNNTTNSSPKLDGYEKEGSDYLDTTLT